MSAILRDHETPAGQGTPRRSWRRPLAENFGVLRTRRSPSRNLLSPRRLGPSCLGRHALVVLRPRLQLRAAHLVALRRESEQEILPHSRGQLARRSSAHVVPTSLGARRLPPTSLPKRGPPSERSDFSWSLRNLRRRSLQYSLASRRPTCGCRRESQRPAFTGVTTTSLTPTPSFEPFVTSSKAVNPKRLPRGA